MEAQLSILIITYNRPEDTLALLANLHRQNNWEQYILEILLLNNASSTDYSIVTGFLHDHPEFPVRYIDHHENLGVARGRNFLIEKAKAPYLLVLDDDVELEQKDGLKKINSLFDKEQFIQSNTAIITLNIHYYETKNRQSTAFPHKKQEKYAGKQWFLTSYFIGAAHLMKKELFTKTGLYPTDFFYGMEEYDLSYRVIQSGYSLGYDDSVIILHKESPTGRIPGKERQRSFWYNKSKVSWRYLPKKYFYTTAFLWSLHYLKKTRFDVKGFFTTWKDVLRIPTSFTRTPLNDKALHYLIDTEAQLYF